MFFEPGKGLSKRFRSKVELTAVDRPAISFDLMTYDEMLASVGKEFTFDIEIYRNYSLIVFMSRETKRFCYVEMTDGERMQTDLISFIMYQVCTVGFNSNRYDLIMAAAMIHGFNCSTLKDISNDIIKSGLRENDIAEKYKFKLLRKVNTYDLFEVAPLTDSLKKYAARMHAKRLQELPYHEASILTAQQSVKVREYCFVDNQNTGLLADELSEQIGLRVNLSKMYDGIELRSKSDAQISEAVIISELTKLNGRRPYKPDFDLGYTFAYTPPEYIHFQTPQLQELLERVKRCQFTLRANGSPKCDELAGNKELKIPPMTAVINGKRYTLGLGGLHSTESAQSIIIKPGSGLGLFDTDFESFYPKMILNNEWYPSHLGRAFLTVFSRLVERRLHAKAQATICKKTGDKEGEKAWKVEADSLKITINGIFGKLGSVFSIIYSPDLLIQTTVTGQLTLLMLIEACEMAGIAVVSANTDGFVVNMHESRRATFEAIVKGFEALSNLKTEETAYSAIYSRDVNNYIAVKTDGEVKVKGAYSEKGSTGNTRLSKNPDALIVADAVVAYLTKGQPIIKTIRECSDLRRFVCVENVRGGGHINGLFLGKTVRWMYGKGSKNTINSVDSGNTVPNSYGAVPMMDLPDEFPANLDHDRYSSMALKALVDIGYNKAPGSLF